MTCALTRRCTGTTVLGDRLPNKPGNRPAAALECAGEVSPELAAPCTGGIHQNSIFKVVLVHHLSPSPCCPLPSVSVPIRKSCEHT